MIDCHEITSREQWLGLRKRDITASVIGALLGVHEYTSAYEQWCLKSGAILPDPEQTAAMERGELLEPVAAELLRRREPTWIVKYPVRAYYSDPAARIGCTPDIIANDPTRDGFGIVQVKSVEASIFRKKWKRDEDGERIVEPPTWIVIQAVVEAALTGASWAAVAPLVVGHGLEMPLIPIPIHAGVMDRLRELSIEFWRQVESNTPPNPDFTKDGETIAQLHGGGNGETVDLSSSNRLPEILDEDEALRGEMKLAKERRDEIKAEIIHALGAATFGTLPGWAVSNKPQTRKAYMVKETTFTVLRSSRVQEKAYAAGRR